MSLFESGFFVLLFVLGSLVLLLPAVPAWLYSRRTDSSFPMRRLFIGVCLLLSYGLVVAASVLFVPIELISIYLAPQWAHDGHVTMVQFVTGSLMISTYFGLTVGALGSILVLITHVPQP